VSDFSKFDADDIDSAFKSIKSLKHHQLLELELQGLRLRLVGYPAGHMIGGTLWSIETGGEVFIYGPATNHMKER
jgi:cleavage and polyadenylation specificity factor subunit 2